MVNHCVHMRNYIFMRVADGLANACGSATSTGSRRPHGWRPNTDNARKNGGGPMHRHTHKGTQLSHFAATEVNVAQSETIITHFKMHPVLLALYPA